jgi:hypothetical protein
LRRSPLASVSCESLQEPEPRHNRGAAQHPACPAAPREAESVPRQPRSHAVGARVQALRRPPLRHRRRRGRHHRAALVRPAGGVGSAYEAETEALLAGAQMAAEGPASNPAPKKPLSAKRTAPKPRYASDGANTHHVVWQDIVSDDTNPNWFKVRSRTLDQDGSHARSDGICAGSARHLRDARNVQERRPAHHQSLRLVGRC